MFEPSDAAKLAAAATAADNVNAKADQLLGLATEPKTSGDFTFRDPGDGAIYLVRGDRAVHLTAATWNGSNIQARVPYLGDVPELLALVTVVGKPAG